MEESPDHPARMSRGYVLQHRLVMEDKLGRFLTPDEVVHHVDRNPRNNHIDNLELHTRESHGKLHRQEDGVPWECRLTEDQVREALLGRTTKEAADFLGVHHMTLRNNFDYLLNKRRTPCDPEDLMTIDLVRQAAMDPRVGFRQLAKKHGISSQVAKSICDKRQILWVKKGSRKTATPSE
jgi:hypothetical protein